MLGDNRKSLKPQRQGSKELGWELYDTSDEVRNKHGRFFADILTVGPGWQKGYDICRAKGKKQRR